MIPRPLAALGLAFAILATTAAPALACRCAPVASARAHVQRSDLAFAGVVTATRAVDRFTHITTFRVESVLKGRAGQTVQIRHNADICCTCGIEYRVGQRTLVFAHSTEGALHTSSCDAPRFSEADYRAAARR